LHFHMPCCPTTKGQNIWVAKGTHSKLSHHKGLVPTYIMKNEMPLVHHVI
jgi:hypothetical protein